MWLPNVLPAPLASCPQRTLYPTLGHLTSASLPSLVVPWPVNDELKELCRQLSDEKHKLEKIAHEKSELESKLKNLSQVLFKEVRDFPIHFP